MNKLITNDPAGNLWGGFWRRYGQRSQKPCGWVRQKSASGTVIDRTRVGRDAVVVACGSQMAGATLPGCFTCHNHASTWRVKIEHLSVGMSDNRTSFGRARLMCGGESRDCSMGLIQTQWIESVFAGGGEMGARMRALDWSSTVLGPLEQWPQSLRACVRVMLDSGYPMLVCWGPSYTMLYNDVYGPLIGTKHPAALGCSYENHVCFS